MILTGVMPSMVPRLALMPDGEDLDSLLADRHAVQRDVPRAAVGDYELPQTSPDGPADVRVTFEDLHGIYDRRSRGERSVRVPGSDEIEQSIEVGQGPRAIGDRGQRRAQR